MELNLLTTAERESAHRSATDLLRAHHAALRRLFAQYVDAADGTREALTREICLELRLYLSLEEETLHQVLRHEAEEAVRRAANVHAAVRAGLDELAELSPYDPEHEAMMAWLIEAVQEHIEEEEARLFPHVEARLPETLRSAAEIVE